MADFGWAFVRGNLLTGSAPPSGAVQYNDGDRGLAASGDLIFVSGATSQLNLTGNLNVIGDFSASANISASAYYGDGSNLEGISSISIANDGANRVLTADGDGTMTAESNFTFDGSTLTVTGTLNVSGTINANEININVENRDVVNISVTGSTKFGDSSDDTHEFTGSMYISTSVSSSILYSNVLSASTINLTGLQAGTPPNTSSYIALDSNYNLVLTSAAGGSGGAAPGVIGEAEDGTYADGLFSDFIASTPIGTAIDKFNEILKIIVPGPAPVVDRINYINTSGIETKLTFGTASSAPTGYVAVATTGSFTSPPGIAEQYTVASSGEDFRLGVYNGQQEITGVVNFHVTEEFKTNELNYSNDAFGNAESGSLKLYLNGVELHSIDLASTTGAGNPNTGSASDLNSSGSGFFAISTTSSATDQNGSEYDIFQHRTAKYVIDPQDQNKGWNYAKIEHEYGSTIYITNFVQWFNDTDASSQQMTVSNHRAAFTGTGSKFLSGVEYFTGGSITYNAEVANVYKNTYPTGNVLSFNTTSPVQSITDQSLPDTDGTDLFNKVLNITGTATVASFPYSLDRSTTITFDLEHPLKNDLSATGSVTLDGILIYNNNTANTNTREQFRLETFRMVSGAYDAQSEVTNSANTWDSENHMTASGASGHTDGLLYYNNRLYSPLQGANGGDFASLENGPAGNPDYSSISGTRTFYRKVQNTEGSPIRDMKIISSKVTKINNDGLGADNVNFYVKIPETTGWMDISQNFSYGNISDGDGALIDGASDNSNVSSTSTAASDHCITFGTASVAANDYVMIRIEADASWTSYFSDLQFQLGASDTDDAATPDPVADLNLTDTAGVDANLSFGTSNDVTGYSNVTGGLGSMSAVNSNALYSDNSDTRRGVFSAFEAMGGLINPTASAGANDAFYNGYTGSLVLEVNGTEYGAIDLAASRNASSSVSSGTGLSVTAVAESLTSDNIPDYTLHYRTGSYSVGTAVQRLGWNYARVIHRVGGTDTTTNYVQWVVDTSASVDTNVSTPTLLNFNHPTTYYQSGIGYFASNPSGSFSFTGSNFYNNVYQDGTAISFPTTTNCSVSNIRVVGSGVTTFDSAVSSCDMPVLNDTADCEATSIEITGTMLYNGSTPSISGGLGLFTDRDVTVTGRVLHPLKTNRTTNSASKTSFMIYSGSLGSTNLNTQEYFGNEEYRVVSGNYVSQSNATSSANSWNSQYSVNDGSTYPAYNDGMVTVNGYAISPLNIGNAGDTRNAADGGSLQAPSSNPNYSTLSESVRTYYRYFRNETGLSKATFTVSLYGDANLVSKSGAFNTGSLGANNNINVELKVPFDPAFTGLDDTSTAWGDCIKPYELGTQPDADGVGVFNGGGSDLDQTVDSDGTDIDIQLQGKQVRDDQYFVLKISAHEDWTGYLSRIAITY